MSLLSRQEVITWLPIFTLFGIEASYILLHSDDIIVITLHLDSTYVGLM